MRERQQNLDRHVDAHQHGRPALGLCLGCAQRQSARARGRMRRSTAAFRSAGMVKEAGDAETVMMFGKGGDGLIIVDAFLLLPLEQ
jgi:hypothetical protein